MELGEIFQERTWDELRTEVSVHLPGPKRGSHHMEFEIRLAEALPGNSKQNINTTWQ